MAKVFVLALVVVAAACGDDGGGGDAGNVPAMITISGEATARSTQPMMLANVTVAAYSKGNDSTPVATTTTDANGKYALVVTTNGQALDGYLKATLGSYLDTYLYPPAPVTADFASASVNMITSNTLDLLANTLCGANQMTTNGVIAVLVVDAAEKPVAGAMVTSDPMSNKICYNGGGFPNRNSTMTDTDGIAYVFNVTGQVTVGATKSGSTFLSHSVNARAGTFTTTVIQP
jgi:hypothetical protein